MAGYPLDKVTINARVGFLATQLRDALTEVARVKTVLDGLVDGDLTAMGYTSTEVAQLRSAFTDLNALNLIAHAQGTQAVANDFFFWANKLTGVN